MFIDEKTQTQIHADLDTSVIHATHRPQDLIPAFIGVIKDTAEYAQLSVSNTIPAHALEDDDAEWWESEDCFYLLNETLFDTLDSYSPEGYYFGSHPGDGSDFGYWKCVDESDNYTVSEDDVFMLPFTRGELTLIDVLSSSLLSDINHRRVEDGSSKKELESILNKLTGITR